MSARMLRNPRLLLAVSCFLAATCLLAPGASAAGTLDQSQTSTTDRAVFPELTVLQTFTAGLTGALDHVDLHLGSRDLDPVDDGLVVSIHASSGTALSATPLASATLPASSVPLTAPDWVAVPFSSPAAVTAGSTYAIVVAQAFPRDTWTLSSDVGDPYPRGSAGILVSVDLGTVELSDSGDLAFRTFVTAAAVPVTSERLCRDTHAALQSSPKYARNRKAVDSAARLLCGILAQLGPRMTPAQKSRFVRLYKAGLDPLVRSGWLTAAQAVALAPTADRLAAGA